MTLSRLIQTAVSVLGVAERLGGVAAEWKERLTVAERLRNFRTRAERQHAAARSRVVDTVAGDPPSSSRSKPRF